MTRMLLVAVIAVTVAGCLERPSRRIEGPDSDGDVDVDGGGGSCTSLVELWNPVQTQVDLLFVVDTSNSMSEEQAVLADQMVVMARELISPSDPARSRVEDLHVAVVSADLGAGGYQLATCDDPASSDGGMFQNTGRLEGCRETYRADVCPAGECPWLDHSDEAPDDGSIGGDPPIWQDFGCIATMSTGGCGFEQPLESSLAALTTQAEPGRPNAGFLRENSLLAIIYVTDEDDCSAADPTLFDPQRGDLGSLNVRCAEHEELLYPIERYHDAFVALRGGDTNRIVVAAITGVPIDGSWDPGDPIETLRITREIDPARPEELRPSCDTAMGVAYPPVRLAELVYAFGSNGVLTSICREDWTPALEAITRMLQEKLHGVCQPEPPPSDASDRCRVVETLSDGRVCPYPTERIDPVFGAGWQIDLGLDASGRRRCEILPADYDDDGCPDGDCDCELRRYGSCIQGWYNDRRDPACGELGRIRMTGDWVVADHSGVVFECEAPCD